MTIARRPEDWIQLQAIALWRRTVDRRREALDNLRRLSVQLDAASLLERRAECSNPTLSAVLRERADERRRVAEIIRAHLDSQSPARSAVSAAAVTFSGWSSRNRNR